MGLSEPQPRVMDQSDTDEPSDDNHEVAKRKERTRACDACRRKKIKCDSDQIPCRNCVGYKVECTFTRIDKPRKAPRRRYVLETRLEQIEHVLTRSNQAEDILQQPRSAAFPKNATISQAGQAQEPTLPQAQFSFLGSKLVASTGQWTPTSEIVHSVETPFSPKDSTYTRLPPKEEAFELLQRYFSDTNSVIPLFQPVTFMRDFRERYSRDPTDDTAWWAALNATLALAIRLRCVGLEKDTELNDRASAYLHNALAVVARLTHVDNELLVVQALLGMTLYLQGTPNPRPAAVLLAAAIRLAYDLRLHRIDAYRDLDPAEAEQRRRVFWCCYALDKDFTMKLEQPPLINDDHMDVDLPSDEPFDGLGLLYASNGGRVNAFRLRVHLAVLQSKTYTDVYSVPALRKSEEDRLGAVMRLDGLLTTWLEMLPLEFLPEKLAKSVPSSSAIHMVQLHLSFFNCLTTAHRVSFHNKIWTGVLLEPNGTDLPPQQTIKKFCNSATRCLAAARESVHLMDLTPHGDYACVW
ncbi:hypothetical protein LTS18_009938 [Coniosporium uncinatum]|uniref:Uncharacterized protein n=1 Tax=Coniosporium uncinatum TaxID=93489 RepID=A0ACC3D9U7_9PEZI|nr:hypothetical protein LTS18_009938 [Coniosporium uncinatum]